MFTDPIYGVEKTCELRSLAATELPSVKFLSAPPVSPSSALTYFASATAPATSLTGFPRAPQIVELAKGLGKGRLSQADYAQRVYEYVYANIRVDFMFGSHKGPLGALVDQAGTPFDQASLMVELLREGGVTANYELGTITLNAAQTQQWFGQTNGAAVCHVLADGGIPSLVNGSSSATCAVGATISSVEMLHVWVSALGNRYDPSYKATIVKQPIDLATATQCGAATGCSGSISTVRSQANSAAMGTADTSGVTGAISAVRNASQSGLETQLRTWATNLKAKLDTTYRDADISDIVGGQSIDTAARPAAGTLPYTFSSVATWSAVPQQYRTTLQVRFDNIDRTLYTDELGGRRLRIYATAWTNTSNDSDRFASLNVEWTSLASSVRADGNLKNGAMTLTINHPYAANGGSYMDETVVDDWLWALGGTAGQQSGPDNESFQTGRLVGTIVQSFGSVSNRAISHYSELSRKDTFGADLPLYYPNSPQLDTVGIAQWCDMNSPPNMPLPAVHSTYDRPPYAIGDSSCTRSDNAVQVVHWLAQMSRTSDLIAAVNNAPITHHHSLGVLLSSIGSSSFLNAESSVSVSSGADLAVDRRAAIYSYAQLASRLEGGIQEQLTDTWEGGSAVSLVSRYNNRGVKFARFDTAAGFDQSPFRPTYSQTAMSDPVMATTRQFINDYLNAGFNITVPDPDSSGASSFPVRNYQPSAPTAPWSIPLSRPFLAVHPSAADPLTPDRIAFLVSWQAGVNWKGAATVKPDDPMGRTMETTKLQDQSLKQRKSYSGDANSGALTLTPAADLLTGAGDFPASLSFSRSYDSRAAAAADSISVSPPHNDADCNNSFFVACSTLQLGLGTSSSHIGGGWDHNFNISASISSDAFQGLGEDSPVDAVGSITALFALRALTMEGPSFGELTTSLYVANWFGANLVNNTVVVRRPPRSSVFVKLPDGSFNAPSNSYEILKQTGSRTGPFIKQPDLGANSLSASVLYDYSPITLELTDSAGSKLNFNLAQGDIHGGDSLAFKQFKATGWTFPSGVTVTFTYNLSTQPHCLQKVENSLGRRLTFDYETPAGISAPRGVCYLKSITDENSRMVELKRPGAINVYGTQNAGAYYGGIFRLPELQVVAPDGTSTTRYTYVDNLLRQFTTDSSQERAARVYSAVEAVYAPGDSTAFVNAQYDSLYRLSTVRDALNSPTSYLIGGGFGEALHRSDVIDALGANTSMYFDRFGAQVQSTDAIGKTTWYVYDARQRLERVISPELNYVRYQYDYRHNKTNETRYPKPGSTASPLPRTYTYMEGATVATCVNAATCNQLKTAADQKGSITNYDYYTNGQLKQIRGPLVGSVRAETDLCYTALGGMSFLTGKVDVVGGGKPNRVTTYSYKDANYKYVLQYATVDPSASLSTTCAAAPKTGANLTTTFDFDAIGNVRTIDGPRTDVADTTDVYFDRTRRLTRVNTPATLVDGVAQRGATRYTYNPDGTLLATRRSLVADPTDPDPSDPRPSLVAAQWQTESRTYWPTGDLRTVTDAENNITQYAYDAVGRTTLVIDPEGRGNGTFYDLAGHKLCEWRGIAGGVPPPNCVWNPSNYSATSALRFAAYEYTDNGLQRTVTDANNNLTELVYDNHDRLKYTFFPNASDGTRCRLVPVAPEDPITKTIETVTPTCTLRTGKTPTYEDLWYTTNGTPTGTLCGGNDQVCRKRTRKAQTITFTYDAMGREATKTATGLPKVTYAYNLLSERTSISAPAGGSFSSPAHTITYDFDDAGRKTFESVDGRQVSYGYAGAGGQSGSRTSTRWPDGSVVSYEYDALGRMRTVWEGVVGAPKLADYDFDVLGRRKKLTLANAVNNRIDYTYEADDNLDLLTNVLNTVNVVLNYGHNRAGQINSINASDAFYLPSPAASDITYVPNKLNQYDSVGGQTQTYDANGNLLTWYRGTVKQTYTYDSENRLRTAATDGTATPSIWYDYDPLGRRITKKVGTMVTGYLSDGDEEVAEYAVDGAGTWGTVLRRYVTGSAIDERIAHVELIGGTAYKTFYHVNHQGSVIAMSNAAGSTSGCEINVNCQLLAYDEYGKLTTEPPASTTGEQFRYTGRRYDDETKLYYYRARYYSPELGRFLQTDPVGYKDDYNLYTYGGNDPLNHTDPSGKCLEDACIAEAALVWYLGTLFIEAAREILANNSEQNGGSSDGPSSASSSSPPPAPAIEQSTPAQPPGLEPEDPNRSRDRNTSRSRERYSGRYADGQKAQRTNVPRDARNNPEPLSEAEGPHNRLQRDAADPSRVYSSTEFDAAGNPVKRTDFAGRGEELPHEHPYNPQTQSFGDKRPLNGP